MRNFRIWAICILLLAIGCTAKTTPDSFEADRTIGSLNGKGASLTITFSKDVGSVSDTDGVKAVLSGNKVVFTQTCDSPDENRKVDFIVRGIGDGESVTVTITLAGRSAEKTGSQPTGPEPFALDDDGSLQINLQPNADAKAWIKAKSGKILGVDRAPINSRVSWKFHPDKKAIAITVAKDAGSEDAKEYEIKVKGENSVGEIAVMPLKFKVIGQSGPFVLDDDGKFEVKLTPNAAQDTQVWVKARSGAIVRVEHAPENSKVSWKHHPDCNAIAITVAKDAGAKDAREYAIKVRGKDSAGEIAIVLLKFKVVGSYEPFVLEDDGKLELKITNAETQKWVQAKTGTIVGTVNAPPENARVTWKYHADKNAIAIIVARDAAAGDARDYEIKVRGKDSAGKSATVSLKFKVVGLYEPFALDDDGKLELKIHNVDTQVYVKAKSGIIVGVADTAPENATVAWKYHPDTKAIAITVARDAAVSEARDYEIKVRGKDSAGKSATVSLKFKVVGLYEPFALDDDGKINVKLQTSAMQDTLVWVKARTGAIVRVEPAPLNSRVNWKYDPDKRAIAITVARGANDEDAREYEIKVRGKDSAGNTANVTLRFAVVGLAEPFALEDDGKLEVKLEPKADRDTQVWVKVRSGTLVRVIEAPENSKVTWKFDADRKVIAITVARDAGNDDAREYSIQVRGQDGAGRPRRVTLRFRVTVPER